MTILDMKDKGLFEQLNEAKAEHLSILQASTKVDKSRLREALKKVSDAEAKCIEIQKLIEAKRLDN